MRGILAAFARNTVFSYIVLSIIFLGGYMAVTSMSRETFPDIHIDAVKVLVRWPGADPEEVEEGICRKIEDAIDGIEGIKRYNTISSEHYGVAIIEAKEHEDIMILKDRVRNAVDGITTFPGDAERPIIEEVLIRIQVCFIGLASDVASERDLKEWANNIKDDLRKIPVLSQVKVVGAREYEISIEVSEEKLREYGITFDQVSQVVHANSVNVPGGLMRTEGEELRLRTLGRNYTGEEFANIVVLARPNGESITLGQIATVQDGFIDTNVHTRFNGKPAVTVSIYKTEQEDTLAIDKAVSEYVEKKRKELPETVDIALWGRMSTLLQKRIDLMVTNGLQGLALVFILLWLFLDIRLSFWVGIGMPVSVMGALIVTWAMGATINMITLFGMVAVLGIIVDDATVVGEAIYFARKNGAPPLKAAVDGLMEVAWPVVASVSTNMVTFIPLLFVSGFMGKLIGVLPIVVIAAFTTSLIECFLLFPAHLSRMPDPNQRTEGRNVLVRAGVRFHRFTNEGLEWFSEHVYGFVATEALRHRYIATSIALMGMLMAWGIVDGGFVKFDFFPEIDGNSMAATVEFPNGTSVEVTEAAVKRIEQAIHEVGEHIQTVDDQPLVKNMFSIAGAKLDDRGGTEVGAHFGTVRVEILDAEQRSAHSEELMALWEKQIGPLPGVIALTFRGDEIKPPGSPIEIWAQGDDMAALQSVAAVLKDKLATYDGVYQIQDDFRVGKNEIKLRLKPEARALGINVADLALQIHAGYFGQEAVRIQRGRDDVRVRVRYPEAKRKQFSELERLMIRTSGPPGATPGMVIPPGAMPGMSAMDAGGPAKTAMPPMPPSNAAMRPVYEVPLISVADIEYGVGYASINRTDGQRRVKVTAEVDPVKANANELVAQIENTCFPALLAAHPGVALSFQGEQQEIRDSINSLMIGFPLAIVGVFIIIATILRSYSQPFIIMFTVPFGGVGAILGHLAMGYDISMMSIFGIVALAGVVVNNAIVMIDCMNTYLSQGETFYDAVRRAGSRRFRPIFLTTITTVGGLAPLIAARDFQAQMLIPMALALASGVGFSMFLTLLLIPSLLGILNDLRRVASWLVHGVWPAPEQVEPAFGRGDEDLDEPPNKASVAPEAG